MGRPSLNLSDEEMKERKKEQRRKYRESEKGKLKQAEAFHRYSHTDNYRALQRKYKKNKSHE